MPSQLTIRGVPDEVSRRLARLSKERGESMNATVLYVLGSAVGVSARMDRLARYATWTTEEAAAFDRKAVRSSQEDDEVWR